MRSPPARSIPSPAPAPSSPTSRRCGSSPTGSPATSTTASAGRATTSTGPGRSSACWRRCPGDRETEGFAGRDGRRLGHDRRTGAEEANAVGAPRRLPVVLPHRRADRHRDVGAGDIGGEALPGEAAVGVAAGDTVVLVEVEGAVAVDPHRAPVPLARPEVEPGTGREVDPVADVGVLEDRRHQEGVAAEELV